MKRTALVIFLMASASLNAVVSPIGDEQNVPLQLPPHPSRTSPEYAAGCLVLEEPSQGEQQLATAYREQQPTQHPEQSPRRNVRTALRNALIQRSQNQ